MNDSYMNIDQIREDLKLELIRFELKESELIRLETYEEFIERSKQLREHRAKQFYMK